MNPSKFGFVENKRKCVGAYWWCIRFPFKLGPRDRPRFFDQVGHQTTNASIGNKHFFTK